MTSRSSSVAAAVVLAGALAAAGLRWARRSDAPPRELAGSTSCGGCHPREEAAWRTSHHARAQAQAPPGERVSLDGEGYPVAARIGVFPLAQWLVPAEGGRLQASAVAWDVRRGERFELFPGETRRPGEWGHFLGRGMTWNGQCAYCHVTGFAKRYDPERDEYASQFVEAGVGCEACHDARGAHDGSARSRGPRGKIPYLDGRAVAPDADACAACHARRAQLDEGFRPGERFLDHFDPTLPDDEALFADGQIRGEDYEWTSFLESKMHARGVTCVDCHDPHTGARRRPGNGLCLQCHAKELDAPAHTHHPPGEGAECTGCHMPVTTYMVRHRRHDHSFSRPLPAATRAVGVPNACNRCHRDRDAAWSERWFDAWWGPGERPALARAEAVAAARRGDERAVPALASLLADRSAPAVWRAAAASLLGRFRDRRDGRAALTFTLTDGEPLVRARAVASLDGDRRSLGAIAPLLRDPSRLVRIAAARVLANEPRPPVDSAAFASARAELEAAARWNADQPGPRLELARLERARDPAAAERDLRHALRFDPAYDPARAALTDLLAEQGRNAEAIAAAQAGAGRETASPRLRWSLAQALLRAGRIVEAAHALDELLAREPAFPGAATLRAACAMRLRVADL